MAEELLLASPPMPSSVPSGSAAKALGAYYTAQEVADFLVWWAVRSPSDRVLDPSFGGGVFLRSACKRLKRLHGNPANQVFGIEIDPAVYQRISEKLSEEFGVRHSHLYRVDFFDFDSAAAPVDAVVGNPPFIRYQRFKGEARARALECASREGVRLSELCSSWAPFLIHSIALLNPGGRLAMVVPAEIGHAAYARPVLEHLRKSFRSVSIASFRKKLFPDLNEDTFLILADGKGEGPGKFLHRDFANSGELARFHQSSRRTVPQFEPVTADMARQGMRFSELFLPSEIRDLYRELKSNAQVQELGQIADVGIGYVTGANDFFHLSPDEAHLWGIPDTFLRPAMRSGRGFRGVRVTRDDWSASDPSFLLQLSAEQEHSPAIRRYLVEGARLGVPLAYKCRKRDPWYRVPHVYQADAFLTYMSGVAPRMVANDMGAVAPNTLHVLRMRPEAPVNATSLAALWLTSLSRISAEIEGHSLGGGMLKLEPTEAGRVLIPGTLMDAGLAGELDQLLRAGRDADANSLVDDVVLRGGLGLSQLDCERLRQGAALLRERRGGRGVA